jgi:hypothetical protein
MADLYESDLYAWAERQAKLAREGQLAALDLPNLAEQMEELVASGEAAVISLARRIMQHLLYLDHSTAQYPRQGWEDEVDEFRLQLAASVAGSRRLRAYLDDHLDEAYRHARRQAERKLIRYGEDEAATRLPKSRPYSLDDVLGPD